MKKWNGLFMKDWMLMRGWFYASVAATVLLAFVLPIVAVFYLDTSSNLLSEGLMFSSPFWLVLNVFTPTIILVVSLGKELGSPDIWLHSPVSVFELFGAKVLFSIITGVINFLLSLLLVTILFSFRWEPIQIVFDIDMINVWVLFMGIMFFASIMLVFLVLFFRVLYIVLRPYTRKLTPAVLFCFIFLLSWLEKTVTSTQLYQKVSETGKIGSVSDMRFDLVEETTYFTVSASNFYVGETLLHLVFAGLLFIIAAVLFERKVRL